MFELSKNRNSVHQPSPAATPLVDPLRPLLLTQPETLLTETLPCLSTFPYVFPSSPPPSHLHEVRVRPSLC